MTTPSAISAVEKHRRQIELSPGVGVEVQQYALAVCDDILADLRAIPSSMGAIKITQEMVDAVNAQDGWSGFTVKDVQGIVDAIAPFSPSTVSSIGARNPLSDEDKKRIAEGLMVDFYLAQGFMEAPEWDFLGKDFQNGFLNLARLFHDGSPEWQRLTRLADHAWKAKYDAEEKLRALSSTGRAPETTLDDVLAWADGVIGDFGTEHAHKITGAEARIAHAICEAQKVAPRSASGERKDG